MATRDALLAQDEDPIVVHRVDPGTLNDLGDVDLNSTGAFPPDGQSLVLGRNGVWVTLAAQHAVALIDPTSGEIIRRITVDAAPYNLVEQGHDLWIADFEASLVLRLDLRTERELARIHVVDPTGIAFGEGSVWVTVHTGRREIFEPVSGPGGQLARINPATNEVDALIDVGHRPYFIATGFGAAWTGNATSGSVSQVDAITNEVTDIPIGNDGAFDIEVAAGAVWVVTGEQDWSPPCDPSKSYFVRIEPRTSLPSGRVDFPCPQSIAPDGDLIWVTGHDSDGVLSALIDPNG